MKYKRGISLTLTAALLLSMLPQIVLPILPLGLFRASRPSTHRLSPSAIARYASSRVAGRV